MFSCIFQSLPYTRWDTVFYADYEMGGKAPTTLKTNTNVEVFEELGGCYLVMADGKPGFVAKPRVSKCSNKSSSGSNGDGSSSGQDGGDISLGVRREDSSAFRCCQYRQCTGSCGWCQRGIKLGDTVQIVAEEGFAPELEGYMTILVDETYAYIPENWVQKDADPTFESRDGFTGYGCQLYKNYQLKGKPVKQVSGFHLLLNFGNRRSGVSGHGSLCPCDQ